MRFQELYKKISLDKELHLECIELGKQFLENKNFENTQLYLGLQVNRVCYNNCKFCSSPSNGKEMNLKKNYEFISNFETICLTGGEALLHSEFNEFIEFFKSYKPKINSSIRELVVMTAGINPKVKYNIKKKYYDSLESLLNVTTFAEINPIINKDILAVVNYSFHLSGIKPKQRLIEFLKKYKQISDKKGDYTPILFKILYNNERDNDKKEKILKKNYFKIFKKELEKKFIEYSKIVLYDKKKDKFNSNDKCLIEEHKNFLIFNFNGDLKPCCSHFQDIKNLPIVANINEDFKLIKDKLLVYYGLMQEFREKYSGRNSDTCLSCVYNFPKFLNNINKGLDEISN